MCWITLLIVVSNSTAQYIGSGETEKRVKMVDMMVEMAVGEDGGDHGEDGGGKTLIMFEPKPTHPSKHYA
jgi:hypothetical protein